MAKKTAKSEQTAASATLMIRLDEESKSSMVQAAQLRGISLSDYVRSVMVPQARRELSAARCNTIELTPDEQLAFWNALHEPVTLTPAQKRLGAIMRGKS